MNISPEFNRCEFAHTPPIKPGNYWIKIEPIDGLNQIEWKADYRVNPLNFSEDLQWDVPQGFKITHWRY